MKLSMIVYGEGAEHNIVSIFQSTDGKFYLRKSAPLYDKNLEEYPTEESAIEALSKLVNKVEYSRNKQYD